MAQSWNADSSSIHQYITQVARFSTLHPTVSMEIGALDGEYSQLLSRAFGIALQDIYLVEPNPALHAQLAANFPQSQRFHYAVANQEGNRAFNAVTDPEKNKRACSSLLNRSDSWSRQLHHQHTVVPTVKAKSLLQQINRAIDLCIIDVEGLAYEVLQSFEETLSSVKSIMIECEHAPIYAEQRHMFEEVGAYLHGYGFRLMAFQYSYPRQSDSIWIQERYVDLSAMRPLPQDYATA